MNRMLSAMLVVVLCIMGAILFYLPWTSIWEKNYFLSHFPSLMRILLHPSFRGAVSGLGVLDIFLAINMIGPDPAPSPDPRALRVANPAESLAALTRKIEEIASAGVDWVQVREKDLTAGELASLTR